MVDKETHDIFLEAFPYIKGTHFGEGLRLVVEKESEKNIHIQALTKDLVRLAILANNVIIKGDFKGEIADDVNNVLQLCKAIHEEYVDEN